MPTLHPVISRVATDVVPFDLWPVAQPDTGWLRLHAAMTPDEVGSAVWSLLFYTGPIGDELAVPGSPADALRLLSEADTLYGAGGLLLADRGTGVTVEPGCCCDLFEWRDWLNAVHGRPIDLGHDPAPQVEYRGETVRFWTESEDGTPARLGRGHIDVDQATLLALLRSAHHDLVGFLAAADSWARDIAPAEASRFVTALDAGLQVSAPL